MVNKKDHLKCIIGQYGHVFTILNDHFDRLEKVLESLNNNPQVHAAFTVHHIIALTAFCEYLSKQISTERIALVREDVKNVVEVIENRFKTTSPLH